MALRGSLSTKLWSSPFLKSIGGRTMKLLVLCSISFNLVWLVSGYKSEGDSEEPESMYFESMEWDFNTLSLPLITCDTSEDCKTECKGMEDKEACSDLTSCDMGIAKAKEDHWPNDAGFSSKKGVCNDQMDCTKEEDCVQLERILSQHEDGSMEWAVAPRICQDGKCVWDGEKGIAGLGSVPTKPE